MEELKTAFDLVEKRSLLEEYLLNASPELTPIQIAIELKIYNIMIAAQKYHKKLNREQHKAIIQPFISNPKLKNYSPEFQQAKKYLVEKRDLLDESNADEILETILKKIRNPVSDENSYEYLKSYQTFLTPPNEKKQKNPGIIIILGYEPGNKDHERYISNGTTNELLGFDIVGRNIFEYDESLTENIIKLFYQDGVMVLDSKGTIQKSKSHLINLDDDTIAKERNVEKLTWQNMGFAHEVGMRQESTYKSSFFLPTLPHYTKSEETGHVRRIVNLDITYSTVPEENKKARIKFNLSTDKY